MENLEHVMYRSQAFLSAMPLNPSNVLLYFSTSQFYDKTSCNEILRMQTQFTGNIELNENIELMLEDMVGIQYKLDECIGDNLYVIYKIERFSNSYFEILDVYYVLDGNIYQAPKNYNLINSRLDNYYYLLSECLDALEKRKKIELWKKSEKSDVEFCNILNDFLKDNKKI